MIIDAVASPPILALPKNVFTYIVDTDESSYQVFKALFKMDADEM